MESKDILKEIVEHKEKNFWKTISGIGILGILIFILLVWLALIFPPLWLVYFIIIIWQWIKHR